MMKNLSLRKLFLVMTAIICFSVFCPAQIHFSPSNLNDKISTKTNVTFLDLVRKIYPDAKIDEKWSGRIIVRSENPIKHILQGHFDNHAFSVRTSGNLYLTVEETEETLNGREKIFWMLSHVVEQDNERCGNCGSRILAAYRVRENEAELIDAGDVMNDDVTSSFNPLYFPNGKSKLMIAPRREALVVYNNTQLSSGTNTVSIIDINQSGFNVVLNEFKLEQDGRCGRSIGEEGRIKLLKKSIAGYRSIEIIVKTEKIEGEDDWGRVVWRRHYRYVFAWNPRTQSYRAIINPNKKREAVHRKYNPCPEY